MFEVFSLFGNFIQIDCGSLSQGKIQGAKTAAYGLKRIYNNFNISPEIFILSHFHIDHYNGLLYISSNNKWGCHPLLKIKEVFFPKIPEFKKKREFIEALFTINLFIFGNETGIMEHDFLKAISKVNKTSFRYKALSQGDKIKIKGSVFEIVWPPKQIKEEEILKKVDKALNVFYIALEKHQNLRNLYRKIKEGGVFEKLEKTEERGHELEDWNYSEINDMENMVNYLGTKKTIPSLVCKANKSLRDIANHLCLAFFEDNRILFMGDVEGYEIKQIVRYLISRDRKYFHIFIPPHHGTHWHKDLESIYWNFVLCSNGPKLCGKMNPNFKSKLTFSTCIHGDIIISI